MDQKEPKYDRRAQFVNLLGPFTGLVSVIVASFVKSSPAVRTVALIVAGAVAACSVYVVFGQPFIVGVTKVCKAIREHHLAPRYLRNLEELVKRLRQLSDRCHTENVACVLCKFPPLWGGSSQDPPGLGHLVALLNGLCAMLTGSPRNRTSLRLSAQWFDLIVAMYNEMCVCEPARRIAMRCEQGLEQDKRLQYERLKREYHKVRLGYLAFLEDYTRLSRDLNSTFGKHMARAWFEKPDELPAIDSINRPESAGDGPRSPEPQNEEREGHEGKHQADAHPVIR
jgi:hypothetical protein